MLISEGDWLFLEAYKELSPEKKAKIIIEILTTPAKPDDVIKVNKERELIGFNTAPLTEKKLPKILEKYFA